MNKSLFGGGAARKAQAGRLAGGRKGPTPDGTEDLPLAVARPSVGWPAVNGRRMPTWPVLLMAAPAFVAIWSGWVGLGSMTGFGVIHPLPGTPLADWALDTAITLPIGVEAYAAYALRVWLSAPTHPELSPRAVRFARNSAIASLALGAAGQVAYHLMAAAHVTSAPWWIVTVVACLPVAVLGMGAALAHLVRAEVDPPIVPPLVDPLEVSGETSVPAIVQPLTSAIVDPVVPPLEVSGETIGEQDVEPPAEPLADPIGPAIVEDDKPARHRPVSDTRTRVLKLREKHPEMSVAAIATKVSRSPVTVRRYLNETRPVQAPDDAVVVPDQHAEPVLV